MTAVKRQPDVDFSLRDLVRATGKSYGAVKVAAFRLFARNLILRPVHGTYRSTASLARPGVPDARLRLHGLKVEACYQRGGWPYRQVFQRVTTVWASPALHRHPNNGSVTGTAEWEGRLITWTLHPEKVGLVEVFMQASNRPLSLLEAYAYLAGTLQAGTGIPTELWKITQADWNIDVPGSIKNDLGITGLSVAGFGRFVTKVYQKADDLVRTEVRSFEPVTAAQVTGYISSIMAALADVRARDGGP